METRLPRRVLSGLAIALAATALLVVPVRSAQAVTDEWATFDPITGSANNYATAMRQQAPGFPAAAVTSDSRAGVQVPGGASTFIGAATPPGLKYGSSQGSPYLLLRPRADTATTPSTTTYVFDAPTPDTGWAFVLGDIDADAVRVRATDATGAAVPALEVASWFRSVFNNAGGVDVPSWDPATSTLTGNAAALDTDGASGWFEPDIALSSLTFVFTRRAGFPVYQTWFVSRSRPIGGTVADVSTTGGCAVEDTALTLLSPAGEVLGTTRPDVAGSYDFGELATQAGYVVRIAVPDGCAVVGPAERTVSNRGNDGDQASRADFSVRQVIPQPISGTVTDDDAQPLAGVLVTLTRPGGGTTTTTTGEDGSYLFDANDIGTGYSLTVTVPAGYAAGPDGTTIGAIEVDATPITDQDFVVVALPTVSGTVTGGGTGLGGVQVVLTPSGGGAPVSVVTDSNGDYAFPGVPAGGYTISIAPPEGYTGTTSLPVTVAATDSPDHDFDLARPGALGGQVTNGDTGAPVPGVSVTVDGPGADPALVTDADGGYFVDGLAAGTYSAEVEPPAGTEVVGPATVSTTITTAGEIRGGLDFVVSGVTTSPSSSVSPTGASPSPSDWATPTATSSPSGPGGTGPGGDGDLPDTGAPPTWWLLLGSVLVAGGGALLLVGGREHRRARHR